MTTMIAMINRIRNYSYGNLRENCFENPMPGRLLNLNKDTRHKYLLNRIDLRHWVLPIFLKMT
jgi:hypothetical protein